MTTHIGNAALTVVTTPSRQMVYVYFGQPAPGDIDQVQLERLIEEKFLVALPDSEVPVATGASPAKSANKDEWLAYAKSQGATDDELKDITKEQLVEVYGD